ncbi:MAG: efflux RND transporter periplasmic adaptor subunit [Planctomycetes bacterium]|nr:efflux RND transporter periplasmic adaptor subunit [Planctomycetota bacterium]MBL7043659.1 efflux RND transporter periplasmic adaptor subunit [Pirellulaceae bacterium]
MKKFFKRLLKLFLVLLVLGGIAAAAYKPVMKYWEDRNRPEWRQAEVTHGDIISVRNATGQVRPIRSVEVGCVVSGPILGDIANFNDQVEKGDLLAEIDPRRYEAAEKSGRARLKIAEAEIKRVEAMLQQATNDEDRALALQAKNKDFISDAELDKLKYSRISLEAQLEVANASIEQAKASLDDAQANLYYTRIIAPEAGTIIDRKIEPGQSLAASFQTPQLFIVAPDMEKEMHIHAAIDETDIGLVRAAKDRELPVQFTVDAYPDDLFEGTIKEIRFSSTSMQNVVTYPVIVSAANPDLKLLPGMTASISFRVDERKDVIKIPNAALRFYPEAEYVRQEDRKLLEGARESEDDEDGASDLILSAEEKAEARRKRKQRHVWVLDGELLRAISVEMGLIDNRFTELVSGELKEGQKLVTRMERK